MKDTRETADADYAKEYVDWHTKTGGFARDMTMRDHFAGLALQALLRDNNLVELRGSHVIEIWRGIPKNAYLIADAMIKERAK